VAFDSFTTEPPLEVPCGRRLQWAPSAGSTMEDAEVRSSRSDTPHVHDKTVLGGVRPADPSELPKLGPPCAIRLHIES
jgi:hypothetical protein